MEQEYTISKGMKIFYGLLAVGLFGFSIFLFGLYKPSTAPAVLLLPIALIVTAILIAINIIRRKVILTDYSVTNINVFSKKELPLKEIKGCRVGQKYIAVEPISSTNSKITIGNYIDLKDGDLLASWFKANFKDLDATDLETENKEILGNASLGVSETDREAVLKKAKWAAAAYNIIGVIVAFSMMLFDTQWSKIVFLAYPLIGIIVMLLGKGLIKFLSNSKRSVYGYVMIGFFMPTLIMLFKALDDYSFIAFNNVWLPFIIISAIVFALLYVTGLNKSVEAVKGQIIFMLVMALIYGFASTRQINCAFDNSVPKAYKAIVLNRRIAHGKHTSYYATLSPWGPMQQIKEEEIGAHLYDNTSIGDTVKVYLKQGLLDIPWFTITKN